MTSTSPGCSLLGTSVKGGAPTAKAIPIKMLHQNDSGWSLLITRGITSHCRFESRTVLVLLPGRHLEGQSPRRRHRGVDSPETSGPQAAQAEAILEVTAIPLPVGCRPILNPEGSASDGGCNDYATGKGSAAAEAALAVTPWLREPNQNTQSARRLGGPLLLDQGQNYCLLDAAATAYSRR